MFRLVYDNKLLEFEYFCKHAEPFQIDICFKSN